MPKDGEQEIVEFKYFGDAEEKVRILEQCKDLIIEAWVRERPGTRPRWWWRRYAPEPARRRLGGVGDPAHEFLAYTESYQYGIPSVFITRFDESYYNGRATDIHGRQIGAEFREGQFKGKGINPDDPPRYESQPAFLDRHGLLKPAERRRLDDYDFEPEIVLPAERESLQQITESKGV